MSNFIIRVRCEGDTWYTHANGARINSIETAARYTYAEAIAIAEIYKRSWRAEVEIIDTSR